MTIACPECGCVIDKGRSVPDHRRLFGLLRAAFHQWSESHAFQPTNESQLRAWALVQTGHSNVAKSEVPPGYSEIVAIRAQYRATFDGVLTR